eukprot:2882210-Prymnesium_polylepis.1
MGCGASSEAPAKFDAPVEKPKEKASRDGMQLSMDKCLNTPDALQIFLDYARKDLSEENLEFWLEVKKYKERFDQTDSQEEHNKDAEWMISQFLEEGSPKQVCIGDTRVKE